jgi:SAM-dependent methyltransferase
VNNQSPKSPKIYTIRNINSQRKYMWDKRLIEDEIFSCNNRNLLNIFIKYLSKKGRILEAGCGLGAWLNKLNELGYPIEGIDIDEYCIAQLKNYKPSIQAKVGNILNTNYGSNTFDAYISLGVVEHFEEGPHKPLLEANRILKPDGVLILTVPYNNYVRKIIYHPIRRFYLNKKSRHNTLHFAEYRYNREEILEFIQEAGFNIVAVNVDDFNSRFLSMGIWADWPLLRGSKPYSLNCLGAFFSLLLSVNKWLTTSGICVVARKVTNDRMRS